MLDVPSDPGELSDAIAAAGGARYRLSPLAAACTYPAFKGEADGAPAAFVKVGPKEEWMRTRHLFEDAGACGLFPAPLPGSGLDWRGFSVFVMEWKESSTVYPEDMTDRQIESFAEACAKLSCVLQRARDFAPLAGSPLAPERLYGDIAEFARRHPVAGRLLDGLLSIPESERTLGSRSPAIVHGDFHAKNFGFAGERFATVFDFDKLTQGLACGDMADALVERYSCLHLAASARRRLSAVSRRLVALAPWPRSDFAISCNIARLRFAARRIRKHPGSAWVAMDVIRRDRKIREFLDALQPHPPSRLSRSPE